MLTLFKNKSFLSLWLAQIVSEFGDGLVRITIIYLISTLSTDPLIFSFVLLATLIPNAVLGTFVGPIVDKYSRKKIMVTANIYRSIILLLMFFTQHSAALLVILIFFQSIGTAFFEPARSSMIPKLVGEKKIPDAIGLSQGTFAAMQIIAPSLAGLLLLLPNHSFIFLIGTGTFVVSALIISFISYTHISTLKSKETSYGDSLKEGFSTVKEYKGLQALFVLAIPIVLISGMINTNINVILLHTFNLSASNFSFLETTIGIGAIIGAVIAPILIKKIEPRVVLLAGLFVIGGICILILPINTLQQSMGVAPIYVWSILIGLSNTFVNVPLNSLLMIICPEDVRGRISALMNATFSTFQIIGIFVAGVLSSSLGALATTALAGGFIVLISLLFPLVKYYGFLQVSTNETKELSQTVNN